MNNRSEPDYEPDDLTHHVAYDAQPDNRSDDLTHSMPTVSISKVCWGKGGGVLRRRGLCFLGICSSIIKFLRVAISH